jgi:hypothetical protein
MIQKIITNLLQKKTMTSTDYLIIVLVNVILFLGSQLQPAYSQSLIENLSSENKSMVSNNTSESLAEKVVDPESLMLGISDQAEENGTLGRMIDECGIIKPSSDMKEGEKMADCQERIINKTEAAATTEGTER